jgi:hypothetical protein
MITISFHLSWLDSLILGVRGWPRKKPAKMKTLTDFPPIGNSG